LGLASQIRAPVAASSASTWSSVVAAYSTDPASVGEPTMLLTDAPAWETVNRNRRLLRMRTDRPAQSPATGHAGGVTSCAISADGSLVFGARLALI
jgi:hypothetical protein